jgi:beta-carotene hydroxylase
MNFTAAIVYGPFYLFRLWFWAFRRVRTQQRRWLVAEAAWAIGVLATGVALWPAAPAVLVYAVLATVGSWVYPLLTVYLPHHHYGETALTQTSTLRGWIIPALFLELTYHLEHHLYPAVPSHQLPRLSQRLDPFFQEAGVQPRRVP